MSPRPDPMPRRSANIFINYRREDSAGYTGRLFDRLSHRFPGRVFMDVDTIAPGIDFVESIEHAVGCCEVLIVMIGREWLKLEDANGNRRLDNPDDFVRLEIAAALDRNIRVIPVLVEDATMPRAEDLPPSLAPLCRRNAIELSEARWSFDVERLILSIEAVLQEKAPSALLPVVTATSQPQPSQRTRARVWMALAALGLLTSAGSIGWTLRRQPAPEIARVIPSPENPVPATRAQVAQETPPRPSGSPAARAIPKNTPPLKNTPPPKKRTALKKTTRTLKRAGTGIMSLARKAKDRIKSRGQDASGPDRRD